MYISNEQVTKIKVLQRATALCIFSPKILQHCVFCTTTPNPLGYGANRSVKLPQPQFPIVQQPVLHNELCRGNQGGG